MLWGHIFRYGTVFQQILFLFVLLKFHPTYCDQNQSSKFEFLIRLPRSPIELSNSNNNNSSNITYSNFTTVLSSLNQSSSNSITTIPTTKISTDKNAIHGNNNLNPTLSKNKEIHHEDERKPSQSSSTPSSYEPMLPHKGSAEEERHSSMAIFFVLTVIGSCILLIHFILETKFRYLPESLAVVFLGAAIGLVMKLSSPNVGDWKKEETLNPTMFFLILLPPIIYESGYTLHKGNFFQNIGSILVFAIIGTSISAFIIGGGIYVLGVADVIYRLSFTESFAFGSLISAVDPVATLAIFHALDVDPILNMLVFGESILNDAVSIVLATTALEFNHLDSSVSSTMAIFRAFARFLIVFFGSAFIGTSFALIAALVFKYVDLRKHPSLEFGMMLIFIYAPYGLAEGLHLSGIMSILANGVVMSHYAHFNLSPVTQITMQQTLRTLSFIAETCVFAYLGLAIFSFRMKIELSLIIWTIVLCLLGRASNIFPLSFIVNYFREHKISKKMMFIMWFSGLRGAIAYALALHLNFEEEKRRVMVTTTLIIVLFTIIILGGSTMPLLKLMNSDKRSKSKRRRYKVKRSIVTLSKTQGMGQAIETDHLSELTEEEYGNNIRNRQNLRGFVYYDVRYLMPWFTRRFTEEEVKDCKAQMSDLTNRWYETVRRPSSSDESDDFELSHSLDERNDDEMFDSSSTSTHHRRTDNDDDSSCYADDEEGRINKGKCPTKYSVENRKYTIFNNNVTRSSKSIMNSIGKSTKSQHGSVYKYMATNSDESKDSTCLLEKSDRKKSRPIKLLNENKEIRKSKSSTLI